MKTSNTVYSCIALAMMTFPAYAASDNNYNLTKADCTKLPSQHASLSDEEFKKRTEWCNKMDGETFGKSTAGKDSSTAASRASSNVNAPINSGN